MSFYEKVWDKMRKIPKGKVTTYKYLALAMGTTAYRAIGGACKANPYAPEVPCHRVVASDGTMGGFGGKTSGKNIEKKIAMLRKEGVKIECNRVVDFEKTLFKFR